MRTRTWGWRTRKGIKVRGQGQGLQVQGQGLKVWGQGLKVWRGRRSFRTATYMTRTQTRIALWLERPIHWPTGHSARPEASASLSLSWEQVTVHFSPATFTVLDDNSLQRVHTAEATTRRHSIFFFAARRARRHNHPPTTSTQPTLDACGLESGPWQPPDREWEREKTKVWGQDN